MTESLLILGASARAAAQSAARLGLRLYCGDLFCDADLPDNAVAQVARSFPADLARIADEVPPGPWMYSGGIENYPEIVARISRRHELIGTAPAALRRVRDPFELGPVLHRAGLLFPDTLTTDERVSADGSWLIKHRSSSGGLRVAPWRAQSHFKRSRGWYFQRRVDGLMVGAVFLAASGRARLLGITEQILIGSGKRPFQYLGSIGPAAMSAADHRSIVDLGHTLAADFNLCGLFGVDLIVASEGVWTIEVNPRYTASVEIIERALEINAIELHLAACGDGWLPECEERWQQYIGKLIIYTKHAIEIPRGKVDALLARNRELDWPVVADIPRAGSRVEAGQPLLTIFAEGSDRTVVQQQLNERQQVTWQEIKT